ncbi:MAG: cytoskeleton protein RodZ [Shewanella sp.]|nr:cytoskeleton protein RodZ [Shewanella sp.]
MTDINDDVSKDDDKHATEHEETLGTILRHARENKGLSQQDVAARLHLRASIVADIENDEFCNIASSTYVRGYVRNYARFLEVDSQCIEACLSRQVPVITAPVMQSFSRKTTQKNRDNWLMIVTYLIVIVSLALLVLWWLQKPADVTGTFSKPTVEELQPESDLAATTADQQAATVNASDSNGPKAEDTPVENPGMTVASNDAGVQDNGVQAPVTGTSVTPTAEADTPTDELSPPAAQVTPTDTTNSDTTVPDTALNAKLDIVLQGDCWIKATDADGNTLVDGLKSAGKSIAVSGKAPISLVLGAPQSVSLSFNGMAVDLARFPVGRVARLTLPQA